MTRVTVGTAHNKNNLPVMAMASVVVFIIAGVVLTVTGHMSDNVMTGLIVSTIPSFIAAAFSERAARDIRNGVVQDKTRQGVHEALIETGVTDIVATAQETQPAVLQALANLNASNTKLMQHIDKPEGTKP